jgi:2-polyprenyl-3-methyl-5-hydroxy-6-metoxy-1,4-benzoquinol methylase
MSTITGNYYDKYNSRNPLARLLTGGFLRSFDALVGRLPSAGQAYEIGCGEGNLSIRLAKRGFQVTASDITDEILEVASRRAGEEQARISFEKKSVYELGDLHGKALIVCCEVLEHLEDPREALRIIASAKPAYALLSVPREPLWRILNVIRFKYLTALGNTPGHVQHWSGKGFLRLLSERFRVLEIRQPLPWIMVLAQPK